MFLTWQDFVFGIGGFAFAPALVPMLFRFPKPPLVSSGLTAAVLGSFSVAFGTLELWLGMASALLTAAAWTILFFQGLRPAVEAETKLVDRYFRSEE